MTIEQAPPQADAREVVHNSARADARGSGEEIMARASLNRGAHRLVAPARRARTHASVKMIVALLTEASCS